MKKTSENFIYRDTDIVTIQHYLIYNDRTKAFIFGRGGKGKASNYSLMQMTSKYFNRQEIKDLLEIQMKNIVPFIEELVQRYHLKKAKEDNKYNLQDLDHINKDDAIRLITKLIQDNQNDAKTISPLIMKLAELNLWLKAKPDEKKANITYYKLPYKNEII